MRRGLVGAAALIVGAAAVAGVAAQEGSGPDLAPFAEHLGFLGYTVEEGDGLLRATHERHLNFTLRGLSGGVMLLAYFEGREEQIDQRRLELAEGLNQAATSARYYWDDDSDLIVESWFPGEHDQQRFAVFMEAWQADGARVFDAEGLTDVVN